MNETNVNFNEDPMPEPTRDSSAAGNDDNGIDNENYSSNNSERRNEGVNDTSQNQQEEVGSVYVTNLSPKTTSDSLRTAFEQICNVVSCTVIMEPRTHASRCFGFVGFPTEEDVEKAIDHTGKILIDDQEIVITRSKRVKGYQRTPGRYMGKPYERFDRRGGYGDRRGGYGDRGGYRGDDRRGGFDDRRGGYDDRDRGYGDRDRGGYRGDDRRGVFDGRRGGYDDRDRGGYRGDDRRGGFDDRRGGYGDRDRGYGGNYNSGGGFVGDRGSSYIDRYNRPPY